MIKQGLFCFIDQQPTLDDEISSLPNLCHGTRVHVLINMCTYLSTYTCTEHCNIGEDQTCIHFLNRATSSKLQNTKYHRCILPHQKSGLSVLAGACVLFRATRRHPTSACPPPPATHHRHRHHHHHHNNNVWWWWWWVALFGSSIAQ